MASRESAIDDDYVAQLLAKEAEEASKKYSELGVRALLPTRSAYLDIPTKADGTNVLGLQLLRRNQTRDS
jgi:hypothetical protein